MKSGMNWRWTDDPDAPCNNCVQWRPVDGEPNEPYWPDGSVPPLIRVGTCESCKAAIVAMMENEKWFR